MNTLLLLLALVASPLQTPQAGATVQGLVTNAANGTILPDAGVELISVSGSLKKYTVATGGDGTFSFKDIPSGSYRVAATYAGFVRAEYGQPSPGTNGRTVTVAAGDNVKDIRIALTETGVISGRILNGQGLPMPNVQVQALRFMNVGPMRFVETATAAITNDLGEYRLFWLPPDEYIVMAMPIRGTVEDNLIRTDGNGYTVNGRVRPSAGNLIAAPTEVPPIPFFFRDGNDPDKAARVDVKPGDRHRGIDIGIRPPLTFAIRGRLVSLPAITPPSLTGGGPALDEREGLRLELEPRTAPTVRFRSSMPNGLINVNADKGTFEIRGVLPGAYWVTARVAGKTARAEVDVVGKDVEDVAVAFVTGFNVPIKVSMVGQPGGPNFQRLIDSLDIWLGRADGGGNFRAEEVPGQPPGTLIARNVVPGEYRLGWSLSGDNARDAYFKSVLLEGIEGPNPFRLDRPPVQPIEVIWGLATGTISGTVTNGRLEPASDVTVVALSARGSYYATSGPDGRFRITGVPPGDFRLFAWEAIKLYSWQDPDIMRRDASKSIAVHLDDGGTASVNLTSIPPPVVPGK
jgi:hypothetical protein